MAWVRHCGYAFVCCLQSGTVHPNQTAFLDVVCAIVSVNAYASSCACGRVSDRGRARDRAQSRQKTWWGLQAASVDQVASLALLQTCRVGTSSASTQSETRAWGYVQGNREKEKRLVF